MSQFVPEFVLIGSFARDYWVHEIAGLPRGAQTLDVDVTILVDSMDEYRSRLVGLEGPGGSGLMFRVLGQQVDLIPYGGIATNGIIEPTPGVTLDVTGMAESVASAGSVSVGGLTVRMPTLASMIGLKVVAWMYRGHATHKDARDLASLLDATRCGPFADELWADDKAGVRWNYDDIVMGPYRAGRAIGVAWRPESIARLAASLARRAPGELAARVALEGGGASSVRGEQLQAFEEGLRTA